MREPFACQTGRRERVLVIGGSGRVGFLLRRAWDRLGGNDALWQTRRTDLAGSIRFDPLDEPGRFRDAAHGMAAILNLAGPVSGDACALAVHTELALAACEAAKAAQVPLVLLASSAAVYGDIDGAAVEDGEVRPISNYGRAKLEMERAVARWCSATQKGPSVTCLRIGNVAGADALLGAATCSAPRRLDIFADGSSPRRSYIGPSCLAGVLSTLISRGARGTALPFEMNVSLRGTVPMAALLAAARLGWTARPAPPGAIAEVRLDVTRLGRFADVADGTDAAAIIRDLNSLMPEVRHAV